MDLVLVSHVKKDIWMNEWIGLDTPEWTDASATLDGYTNTFQPSDFTSKILL